VEMEGSVMWSIVLVTLVVSSQAFWLDVFKSEDEVKFNLNTRKVNKVAVQNNYRLSGLKSFNPKEKTYFIIHGWNGGGDKSADWIKKMMAALLKKSDANIFVVDWGKWAKNFNYLKAKGLCDDAGRKVAEFIKNLEKNTKASRKNMHIIGHSLGGQVAGFAGANLKSPKVARITGLDTSGIGFNCLFDPNDCLDPSDADFVDEIHTLVSGVLTKGHADYFPIPKDLGKAIKETAIIGGHWLAAAYFTDSIEAGSCAFKSTKCSSYNTFSEGGCQSTMKTENRLGFYAKKPSTKPPNRFYIDIDVNNPC